MIEITVDKWKISKAKDGGSLKKIDTTIIVNGEKYYGRSIAFVTTFKDEEKLFCGDVHYVYDGAGEGIGHINGELTKKKVSELFMTRGIIA